MKKIFVEILDVIIYVMESMAKHRWITNTIMVGWLALTVVLNSVYYGKPIPITHTVLKPIWAYINVVACGCVVGTVIGYVNTKSIIDKKG